ncbi:unnamed protein product [Leuciscus chuanchicus]
MKHTEDPEEKRDLMEESEESEELSEVEEESEELSEVEEEHHVKPGEKPLTSPRRPAPKQTRSWLDFLQPPERSTYILRERTGQSKLSFLSSSEENGGGWNALRLTTCERKVVERTLGTYPGLGLKETLTNPGAKSKQDSLTERACKSPTRFNEDKANKRETLRVRIRSGADSKGSKGAFVKPSRTIERSHEGTLGERAGFRRLTPRMKAETNLSFPRGISSDSLCAAIAAT